MELSFVRDRSPRLYARFLGASVMWWPRPVAGWFRVRWGNRVLLVVDVGRLEILVG
jgi:hypothetical protein